MKKQKELSESIAVNERLKAKLKTVGKKKPDLEIDQQTRPSKKTKRPAVKTITVDRSSKKTIVTDEVRELNDNGEWEIVHKHKK